jgi:hypothetical protein
VTRPLNLEPPEGGMDQIRSVGNLGTAIEAAIGRGLYTFGSPKSLFLAISPLTAAWPIGWRD